MHTFVRRLLLAACLVSPCALASSVTVVVSSQAIAPDARPTLFLAGSIDMGKAGDWQRQVIAGLSSSDVVILNPRRTDWNSAWKPELADAHFAEQVNWELAALDRADVIAMYLAPGSQSPVSLLELGLHARSDKLIVFCPEGFWRKGNVDATVARYGIEQADSMEDFIARIRRRLAQHATP